MASRAQSFNKILLTTSNTEGNNILLQEISGALYVNDNPVAISGANTFTSLSDTPSDFTAGKYLRVNDAGDTLEYVDITGVSSGSGSGGSSNQCGINSLELTNDHPSTDSINIAIPDAIIATNTSNNDFILLLGALTKNSTDLNNNRNLIYNAYGTQYSIDFTNDANGSYYQSQGIIAAHQQNLKWFIDNGRALYYGSCGGSGTGAYSSNSTISDNLSFAYNFPDALLVPLTRGGGYQERVFPFVGVTNSSATSLSGVWSGGIFSYELALGSERFILIFDNDTSGTFNSYSETSDISTTDVVWSEMSPATTNQPTLKEFIDANRAIYYK